jgi:hypothetical protein
VGVKKSMKKSLSGGIVFWRKSTGIAPILFLYFLIFVKKHKTLLINVMIIYHLNINIHVYIEMDLATHNTIVKIIAIIVEYNADKIQ